MKILRDQTFWLGFMTAAAAGFFALFLGMMNGKVAFDGMGNSLATAPTPTPAAPAAPGAPAAPPEIKIAKIGKDDHVKGPDKAKITLVEYSSFTCGYCNRVRATIDRVLAEYPDDVRVVYRHFDRGGPDSAAATASECAGEQGKFWEMHDELFDKGATGNYVTYATDLGLDVGKFESCVAKDDYSSKIKAQTAEAIQSGINGTPGFVVDEEELIPGAVPFENFKAIIDQRLAA